jgi:ribosome-binding protein aMBF1 (putative translation factor)
MKKSIHTDGYRDLIDILVNARKKAGLTQQELADKLRKPQSFVAKYEGLERRLDIAEYIRVGEHIGVAVKIVSASGRKLKR